MTIKTLDKNSTYADLEIFAQVTNTTQDCFAKIDPDFLRRLMDTRPIFLYLIEEPEYKIAISYQHNPKPDTWLVKSSAVNGDISAYEAVRVLANHYAFFMEENNISEMMAIVLKTYENNKRFQRIRDNLEKAWTINADGNPIPGRVFEIVPTKSYLNDHFLLKIEIETPT